MDPNDQLLTHRPESRIHNLIANKDWQKHPLGPLSHWPKSLVHTIDCLLGNPNPMMVLWGEDHLWQFHNDAYLENFEPKDETPFALGESAKQKTHCAWTDIEQVAAQVFAGKFHCHQLVSPSKGLDPRKNEGHYHFNFSPIWGTDARAQGILACGHITEPDYTSKPYKIKEHCEKHMAMAVLSGRDFKLDFASEKIMQYWGISLDDMGQPLLNAVPSADTAQYYGHLIETLHVKEMVKAPSQVVSYQQHGEAKKKYVDFCFDPCLDETGDVTDIIVTASDVTYKEAARRKIRHRKSETFDYAQRLEVALSAGNLGCFELFMSSGKMNCTDQCKANFGQDDSYEFTFDKLIGSILEDDRDQMQEAVSQALKNKSDYFAEFRVLWPDQSIHWISGSGRGLYSADGKAVKMVGVTREVTREKQQQQQLEGLVEQRTRELTDANHKLRRANWAVSENVKELSKSNANLEGFAYTASHDLQEPLRKIQTFGTLLKKRLSDDTDPECIDLIDRMQAAGHRMSVLITGLLDLSRLSVQHKMLEVNLNEAVQLAIDALELKILETTAIIQVDNLNTVYGDLSQLTQLFQNLIGNSLRFISPDRQPVIRISCSPVPVSKIARELLPGNVADAYHEIVVSDNGIGFAQQHAKKIFEVFQRLHGRSSYEGTGIGLSICKQVVDNHDGVILASGEVGVGATFTVLLPVIGVNK